MIAIPSDSNMSGINMTQPSFEDTLRAMEDYRAPEHEHQWFPWMPYDHIAVEMEMTDGFRYHRSCQIMGCYIEQHVEWLEPTGKSELKDMKELSK
jgi:hypothetical protein